MQSLQRAQPTESPAQEGQRTEFTARVTSSQPAPTPDSGSQKANSPPSGDRSGSSQPDQMPAGKPSSGDTRQPPHWLLTLTSGGKSIQVSSERPLATGTLVTLASDKAMPSLLKVISTLPPGTQVSSQPTPTQQTGALQTGAQPGSGIEQRLQQAISQLLTSRIPWQPSAGDPRQPPPSLTYQQGNRPAGSHSQLRTPAGTRGPVNAAIPNPISGAQVAVSGEAALLARLQQITAALPTPLQAPLRQFTQALPTEGQLSQSGGIRNAVEHAPVHYERNLFRGPAPSNSPLTPGRDSRDIGQIFQQLWSSAARTLSQAKGESASSATPSSVHTERKAPGISANSTNLSSAGTSQAHSPSTTAGKPTLMQLIAQLGGKTESATLPTGTGPSPGAITPSTQSSHPALVPAPVLNNLKGLMMHLIQHWPDGDRGGLSSGANASAPQPQAQVIAAANAQSRSDNLAEVFRLIQQAVAQTEQEQVRLLQSSDPTPTYIPLLWRQGDHIQQAQLGIWHHPQERNTPEKEKRWQLTLHFDLAQLGPLDVELDLRPSGVSAIFWSEKPETLSQLNQALQPLRRSLTDLGADVTELMARHGRRPPRTDSFVRQSLVDIHT